MKNKSVFLVGILFILSACQQTTVHDKIAKVHQEKKEPQILEKKDKYVAVTFDDGPSEKNTSEILSILKANNAKATFFVVGKVAARHPKIIQAIKESGNEIANHSYSHPVLSELNESEIQSELAKTNLVLSGHQISTRWFRPPYGMLDYKVKRVSTSMGMQTALWSIDPKDWQSTSADEIKEHVLSKTESGDIILLHDTKQNTKEALQGIIEGLHQRGFKLLTLSEMQKIK